MAALKSTSEKSKILLFLVKCIEESMALLDTLACEHSLNVSVASQCYMTERAEEFSFCEMQKLNTFLIRGERI